MLMRPTLAYAFLLCAPLIGAVPFNCSRGIPLQTAIDLSLPGETLELSGTCSGPFTITAKNLALMSRNGAVIDGGGKDALTISGPARVRLNGLTLQNGKNGISAASGAQLMIESSSVQNNSLNGLFLAGGSSATITVSKTNDNAVNGLDAEASPQ